jgi:hypothetical protein
MLPVEQWDAKTVIYVANWNVGASVGTDTPAPYESFQRHFFVPLAWLSTPTNIISMVTTRKDILFVRGYEVAIVRKGLETVEVVSIC